jgi:hypothetical protein
LAAGTLVGAAAALVGAVAAVVAGALVGAAAALVGAATGAGAVPHPATTIAASNSTQTRGKQMSIFGGWFIAILIFMIVLKLHTV